MRIPPLFDAWPLRPFDAGLFGRERQTGKEAPGLPPGASLPDSLFRRIFCAAYALTVAPCFSAQARVTLSMAACTSSSVRVRSGARKVSEKATLLWPAATCAPR